MPQSRVLIQLQNALVSSFNYPWQTEESLCWPNVSNDALCLIWEHLFGQVVEGEMHRNELGEYVALCWEWLPRQYPYVDLDERMVMLNHLHGIIVITHGRGASRSAPTSVSVDG